MRRSRKRLILVALTVYLCCWALTYGLGRQSVLAEVDSQFPREWRRVGSFSSPLKAEAEGAWLFIGNVRSPCPFVLSVEFDYVEGPLDGVGGRKYFLWLGPWLREIGIARSWIA